MIVVYELIRRALEMLTGFIGLHGIAIGTLAGGLVGLYYMRELAGVFVLVARYARVLSIVGFVLLVVLVGGNAAGVLEIGDVGSLVESLGRIIGGN